MGGGQLNGKRLGETAEEAESGCGLSPEASSAPAAGNESGGKEGEESGKESNEDLKDKWNGY